MSDKKVVLAYSGGLDTTCILFWLREQGYQVICYTANVGQTNEDFDAVKRQAIKLGALEAIVEDLRSEFVDEFIYPALAYGAVYQGRYLLGTSLARPVITRGLVRTAQKLGAHYIANGATGKGNDQVRFELSAASLAPHLKCIAPWRQAIFYERFKGRSDLMQYAQANGFTTPATPSKPYSMDANMMHISYESGILEDPACPADEGMFLMTKPIQQWPDEPDEITLIFKAGKHGIGRIDIVEDRMVGMKSRGVYETPAATLLFVALRDLELMLLDREVNKIKSYLVNVFAEQVYNGMWYSPECAFTRHCLQASATLLTGQVTLMLYKGQAIVKGRSAAKEKSLYDADLVSMDSIGSFTPEHAEGFIRTQAVRLQTYAAKFRIE